MIAMPYQRMSRMWSIIIIVVMLFFLWMASNLKYGKIYPMVIILATIFFALVAVFLSYREEKRAKQHAMKVGQESLEKVEVINAAVIVSIVVPVVFLSLWDALSFMACAFLTCAILMIYKKNPIVKSLVIAALIVLSVQYVFVSQFNVRLPSPGWWIW